MASKGRIQEAQPEESTRRRIQDVLGQARAALRSSQQFRPRDDNRNLSSRLAFQQQNEEPDFWTSIAEPQVLDPKKSPSAGEQYLDSTSNSRRIKKYDDLGPFRESVKTPLSLATSRKKNEVSPSHLQKSVTRAAQDTRQSSVVSSSSTISVNTNDLMVSDEGSSYTSETESDLSISSLKRTPRKKESIMKDPVTIRLTPLAPAPPPPPPATSFSQSNTEEHLLDGEEENLSRPITKLSTPIHESGTAQDDENPISFSRAFLTQKDGKDSSDFWFEKALLVRGETISEAAYKAFKKVYADKDAEAKRLAEVERQPIFKDTADPEYTADWISDSGSGTDEMIPIIESEVDFLESVENDIVDIEDDDVNTVSMVRTLTDLEASGVLDEIAENLQEVLEVSEMPESMDFSRMSVEEKTFAKEYDQAMLDKNEPLQTVFSGLENESDSGTLHDEMNGTESSKHTLRKSERNNSENIETENENTQGEEYENTFITTKSSKTSTHASSSSKMKRNDESKSQTKNSSSVELDKTKSSSSSVLKSKSKSVSSAGTKSKSSSVSSSRRLGSLPPEYALDPPTSRYQKNIQSILEKEVYEKELKKARAEKIKEERNAERHKKMAKESIENNSKVIFKEPNYTEILLPELFKYKSVSGLKAAKAKRTIQSIGPQADDINYGAPYFNKSGALTTNDYGVTSMAAQVESLDIPDLVREVLASNERMYRMTVEASEQMTKKYRDKIRTKSSKSNNRRR